MPRKFKFELLVSLLTPDEEVVDHSLLVDAVEHFVKSMFQQWVSPPIEVEMTVKDDSESDEHEDLQKDLDDLVNKLNNPNDDLNDDDDPRPQFVIDKHQMPTICERLRRMIKLRVGIDEIKSQLAFYISKQQDDELAEDMEILASHFVNVGNNRPSEKEIEAMLFDTTLRVMYVPKQKPSDSN